MIKDNGTVIGQLIVRKAQVDYTRNPEYELPKDRKLVFVFGIIEVGEDMPTNQVLNIQGAHQAGSNDLGFDVMSSAPVPSALAGWPVTKFVDEFKWADGRVITGTADADWIAPIDEALRLINLKRRAPKALLKTLREKIDTLPALDAMRTVCKTALGALERLEEATDWHDDFPDE